MKTGYREEQYMIALFFYKTNENICTDLSTSLDAATVSENSAGSTRRSPPSLK
jgi:hypothetical protein